MSASSKVNSQTLSKLDSLESKLAKGLDQVQGDIDEFEHEEDTSSSYVDNLDSLSRDQIEDLEHGFDVETGEGNEILDELKQSLSMEKESIKALTQVLHRIDENNEDIEDKETDIDAMLKKLQQEAENGNVDEELAGKCLAEIMAVKDEIKETADLEYETSDTSERLEEDLSKSHQELVEMKRDERELEKQMEDTESWAESRDVEEMQRFVDQKGSPDLVNEIEELKKEIQQQQSEEEEFVQNLAQLAEEGHLTERQIDHLITQQQEWSTVAKQALKDGTGGFKKIGDALFGFTPMGVAMGATKGAAQELDKDQVMSTVRKASRKVRRTAEEAESEVETSVQETQTTEERLKEAKGS